MSKKPGDKPTGQEIQVLRTWLIGKGLKPNEAAKIAVANVVLSEIAKKARAVFRDLPKAGA